MLDREGYRPNVGIILVNARNEVFWGKRVREHAWQFPQGASNTAKRRSRRCTASCSRKSGCGPSMCRSWAARASGCAMRCRGSGSNGNSVRPTGAEADLVSAPTARARLRRFVACERAPGIRRLALEQLLGSAGLGDRVQARGVPARTRRIVAAPFRAPRGPRRPRVPGPTIRSMRPPVTARQSNALLMARSVSSRETRVTPLIATGNRPARRRDCRNLVR